MESDNEGRNDGSGGRGVTGESVFRRVLGSTVRTDVLQTVAADPAAIDDLIDGVDASESAVYNAVGDLERQGLLRSTDDRLCATGSGQLVADLLTQQGNLCELLSDDYWRTHDVASIPRRFRLRLTELAGADVFRAPETDPHAVVRRVTDRVDQAGEHVDIVTPIYQAEYEAVMPDAEDARLIVDGQMVEEAIERVGGLEEARQFEQTGVRVLDVDVGVGVTDEHLMLSLPTIDGSYDSRTEVFATDERALAWGRDLFEYYWDRATPDDQFIAERFP